MKRRYILCGLELEPVRNAYTGLWEVRYTKADGGHKWAGPFKTKREAVAKLDAKIPLDESSRNDL
ncbi:hypothetical protein EVB39_096 [Rhizobium phage RHph_TM3_3_9]|nr:hypothetical protein EVB39_096 [Rhizobium phage RHph_TM3_3_9]QIG68617.1 hypothetical protein EVB66_096 [Rhizobium phage RHph_TM3_3_13]QIG74475.1 hypothetical protein EVC09_095 [Rhizobium phage RHph_TM3_3_10]QXV74589.1 hypothetical protein [Rhizobium phage RHEph19]